MQPQRILYQHSILTIFLVALEEGKVERLGAWVKEGGSSIYAFLICSAAEVTRAGKEWRCVSDE